MPIEKILPLLNFAIGFTGLVSGLIIPRATGIPKTRSYIIILVTCLVAFVATGSALLAQAHERSAHLEKVSEALLDILNREARTVDQLDQGLPFEDFGTVTEALGMLVKTKRVGHRMVEVRDNANLRYDARLYFRIPQSHATSQ